MRILIVLGMILITLGGYIILEGWTYTSERTVVRIGEMQASLEENHPVPRWVGGLGIVAGLALVVMGGRRRPPRVRRF